MVPPYSDRISRVPPYLSLAQYHTGHFTYGAITRYGQPFQAVPLCLVLSLTGSSDFARHYFRNLGWCLFLELLRCFSSPGSPRMTMYSSCDTFRWVSPFGNLRIKANLPAPRSLSQAITSFVAYHCQGIHHVLLFTWPYNFELSLRRSKIVSRNYQVFHLARYAVTFKIRFDSKLKFLLTQSKILCCWWHGLH